MASASSLVISGTPAPGTKLPSSSSTRYVGIVCDEYWPASQSEADGKTHLRNCVEPTLFCRPPTLMSSSSERTAHPPCPGLSIGLVTRYIKWLSIGTSLTRSCTRPRVGSYTRKLAERCWRREWGRSGGGSSGGVMAGRNAWWRTCDLD
jgi:hypothetical protein